MQLLHVTQIIESFIKINLSFLIDLHVDLLTFKSVMNATPLSQGYQQARWNVDTLREESLG